MSISHRWIAPIFFTAIFLTGGILYFAHRTWERHLLEKEFRKAADLLEQGNLLKAQSALKECFRNDPKNLKAGIMLAELYEKNGDWKNAAFAWSSVIAKSNSENPDFSKRKLTAEIMGGMYGAALRTVALEGVSNIPNSIQAYVHFRNGDTPRMLRALRKAETMREPKNSWIEWLSIAASPDGTKRHVFTEKEKILLQHLSSCGTVPVETDALRKRIDLAKEENAGRNVLMPLLEKNMELDPRLGGTLLGDYLFSEGDAAGAEKIYRKIFLLSESPETAVRLGEALAIQGKADEISLLRERFRSGGGRKLPAGYYLEALSGWLRNDKEAVARNMVRAENFRKSPCALFLNLLAGIGGKNIEEVRMALKEFYADPDPSFREKARSEIGKFMEELVKSGDFDGAGTIATLFCEVDRTPVTAVTEALIEGKLRSKTLTGEELAAALQDFPESGTLLHLANLYALQNGHFPEALAYAERERKAEPDSVRAKLDAVAALEELGRFPDAEKIFADLRKSDPENQQFARLELLNLLREGNAEQLKNFKVPENAKPLGFFAEIGTADASGDHVLSSELAEELPQKVKYSPADAELWFYAGNLLLRNGFAKESVPFFESASPDYPVRELLFTTLAEALVKTGEFARALEFAEKAWLAAPDSIRTRECYGLRLAENGKTDRAAVMLGTLLDAKEGNRKAILPVWRNLLKEKIAAASAAGNYSAVKDNAERLLEHDPENEFAKKSRLDAEQSLRSLR